MYDELVKRLRSESSLPYFSAIKDMREAADAIENLDYIAQTYAETVHELKEMNRWIPVTERLPEESWERVLAYTDDGTVMTLPAIKLRNGYVRYWMPLPELPKERT